MSGQKDLLHILKDRKAMEEKPADEARLWTDALMADIPIHQFDLDLASKLSAEAKKDPVMVSRETLLKELAVIAPHGGIVPGYNTNIDVSMKLNVADVELELSEMEPAEKAEVTNALDDLTGGKFSEIFGSV